MKKDWNKAGLRADGVYKLPTDSSETAGDVDTHSDVISELHGAVLILICQVDAVQMLKKDKYH